MEFERVKARSDALTSGRWISGAPGIGDARLFVRSMAAPAVTRAWGRAMRQIKDRDAKGNPTDAAERAADLDVLAEAVLLDWEGFTEAGEAVPFDAKTARRWLDVELFEVAVRYAASEATREANEAQAALEKN